MVSIVPNYYERRKVRRYVTGIVGDNTITFDDKGVEPHYGMGIDNVALYKVITES